MYMSVIIIVQRRYRERDLNVQPKYSPIPNVNVCIKLDVPC